MLRIWGADGSAYAGRRMTLFRDDGVQFGGVAVGGIRISHMSGISSAVTMALTATKARRVPYTVKPLAEERSPAPSRPSPTRTTARRNSVSSPALATGFTPPRARRPVGATPR